MTVYVYQGYLPAGGTYMAYHLGRILHQYFACDVRCVGERPLNSMFEYAVELQSVSEEEFLASVTADDLLICNPSFSAQQFGLRLPCRKLSYIQGIRTFAILDVSFDHYVFVSEWARDFVSTYYGISGNVIPAFIGDRFYSPQPDWSERRSVFLLSQRKFEDVQFKKLLQVYASKFSGNVFPYEVIPILPQHQLAEHFRAARFYLSLDAMEGFGLPMLEAMASGCAVAGWDSGGNREYAHHAGDSMLARYGDFDTLADHIHLLLENEAEAKRLSYEGTLTGRRFDMERFDKGWVKELADFLHFPPLDQSR